MNGGFAVVLNLFDSLSVAERREVIRQLQKAVMRSQLRKNDAAVVTELRKRPNLRVMRSVGVK